LCEAYAIIPNGKKMSRHTSANTPLRTPAQLGAVLRTQRKAQGLTLEQLSGLSGLGMRFLSELERGKVTAELGKTLEVARLLGMDCFLVPRSESSAFEERSPVDGDAS